MSIYYERIKEEVYTKNCNSYMKTIGYFCAAVFEREDGLEAVSIGLSLCKKGDKFNKEIGREIALANAIKNLIPGMYKSAVFKNRDLGDNWNSDDIISALHKFIHRVQRKYKDIILIYPKIEWY